MRHRIDRALLRLPLAVQRVLIAPLVGGLALVNGVVDGSRAAAETWRDAYEYLHDRQLRDRMIARASSSERSGE